MTFPPLKPKLTSRPLLWSSVLVIALGLSGCNRHESHQATLDPPTSVPQLITQFDGTKVLRLAGVAIPGMTTIEVSRIEMPGVLEANGQVAFDDQKVSTIVSRVAGRIEATRVSQWDDVRRGEKIVSLYSPDFMTAEAEYLQAQATARLSSAPALADSSGAISGGTNMAASMVSAAHRKLSLLGMNDADIAAIRAPNPIVWMRAPISGTVIENKAMRGGAVNPGDVLYSLGTLSYVWILANIYEDDLARVHSGQQLEAVTTAYPNQVFVGIISRISPSIDANTHTLQIRCEVRNSRGQLKPEMLVRVRIITSPGYALVVPMESLVFDPATTMSTSIWVVENSIAAKSKSDRGRSTVRRALFPAFERASAWSRPSRFRSTPYGNRLTGTAHRIVTLHD